MAQKIYNKKRLIALGVLFFLVIGILIYFKPMLLNRTLTNEAKDFVNKIFFEVDTDKHLSEEFFYLDSDNSFDYYCVVEYQHDGSTQNASYLAKVKDNQIASKYDLSGIDLGPCPYIERGICKDGYLYFIVRSVNAIYRIDGNLSSCEKYIKTNEYGDISYSSLSLHNNDLLYITDKGNIINYCDGNEVLIRTVPSIKSVFGGEPIDFNEFSLMYNYSSTTNYIICSNDDKVFYAASNKLYVLNSEKDKEREIRLNLREDAYIRNLSFSEKNPDLLFVCFTVNIGPWEPRINYVAVLNTKTGGIKKFEQPTEYRVRNWKTPDTELQLLQETSD